MPLEEGDRPAILARGRELLREALVQCECGALLLRLGRGRLPILPRFRSGLRDENARAQADE
ncbi:MAG TPA: hypothetical protein VLA69_06480 [Gaiellaceae bacterium]|nr:hypothetical protein [Gaiellaceae bacterium]